MAAGMPGLTAVVREPEEVVLHAESPDDEQLGVPALAVLVVLVVLALLVALAVLVVLAN